MPRRKIQLGLIGKAGSRTRTFKQRKEGLEKKAKHLATLCDIDVAVVCAGPGGGAPDVWEFGAGVIDRYRKLPADKRAKHTHLSYLNVELAKEKAKLAKERQEGPKALASPGAALLKDMKLEELLGSIDAALLATARRRKALGMPDDGAAEGGQLRQAALDAVVPRGQGVPFVGDDFDDMEAWVDELTWPDVEPHPLNSSMTQPAAGVQYINGEPHPLNAGMMQPASGVQYTNGGSMDMGGDQCLQQMGGNGENDHGQQVAWDALRNTVSYPDYGFQYTDSNDSDMNGCSQSQMPVPSNANGYDGCWFDQAMWGTDESSRDAVVPIEYYHPSLDTTCYPVYMPPEHSSTGTGDCFTGVSAIGVDGSFMDAHEYGTQSLADCFEFADVRQQTGVEPLHYLSDVAEGIGYYNLEAGSLVQSSPSQM